jgi:hypothetical protein
MNNRREDIKLPQALLSLRPGAQWTCYGDKYEDMIWHDKNIAPPTKEETELEIERLRDEWDYNKYQRLRAKEYPSFAKQLDLLYHGGYDGWKATIDEVKNKYPKPENL